MDPRPNPHSFDRDAAARIVAATRRTEALAHPRSGAAQRSGETAGETILARLTSQDATEPWKYAWEEVRPNGADWIAVTDGRTGTIAERYAFDANRLGEQKSGQVVTLRLTAIQMPAENGPDGKPLPVEFADAWVIVAPDLGTGQYQYMVFQMVAQGVRGWDYTQAHPAP